MKMKTTLLAATLAAFAASAAIAAEEHPADAKTGKAEAVKEEKAEAKKPMKKHNHMEEKTGMPMPESAGGKSHRETMNKDMPMHDHTKDRH